MATTSILRLWATTKCTNHNATSQRYILQGSRPSYSSSTLVSSKRFLQSSKVRSPNSRPRSVTTKADGTAEAASKSFTSPTAAKQEYLESAVRAKEANLDATKVAQRMQEMDRISDSVQSKLEERINRPMYRKIFDPMFGRYKHSAINVLAVTLSAIAAITMDKSRKEKVEVQQQLEESEQGRYKLERIIASLTGLEPAPPNSNPKNKPSRTVEHAVDSKLIAAIASTCVEELKRPDLGIGDDLDTQDTLEQSNTSSRFATARRQRLGTRGSFFSWGKSTVRDQSFWTDNLSDDADEVLQESLQQSLQKALRMHITKALLHDNSKSMDSNDDAVTSKDLDDAEALIRSIASEKDVTIDENGKQTVRKRVLSM